MLQNFSIPAAFTALALSVHPVARPHVAAVHPAPASRVDSFQIAMPQLGDQQRMVRVYLPPAYATTGVAYSVLYLQDAQQLFAPGWFGDWRIDETLDSLVAAGRTRGIIVVGVDNGGARRWDEYSPWVNRRMREWVDSSWAAPTEGGEGDAYLRFLTETLKPAIDRRYRTLPDRAHTGIGGSSMGGLISLYAGLARPDIFSRVMAMSTAVWFAEDGDGWLSNNMLLKDIAARARSGSLDRDVRFYVDAGTNERSRTVDPDVVDVHGGALTYPRAYSEGAEAVVRALRSNGVPEKNIKLVLAEGAEHNEKSWASRFPGAVMWLFE